MSRPQHESSVLKPWERSRRLREGWSCVAHAPYGLGLEEGQFNVCEGPIFLHPDDQADLIVSLAQVRARNEALPFKRLGCTKRTPETQDSTPRRADEAEECALLAHVQAGASWPGDRSGGAGQCVDFCVGHGTLVRESVHERKTVLNGCHIFSNLTDRATQSPFRGDILQEMRATRSCLVTIFPDGGSQPHFSAYSCRQHRGSEHHDVHHLSFGAGRQLRREKTA